MFLTGLSERQAQGSVKIQRKYLGWPGESRFGNFHTPTFNSLRLSSKTYIDLGNDAFVRRGGEMWHGSRKLRIAD